MKGILRKNSERKYIIKKVSFSEINDIHIIPTKEESYIKKEIDRVRMGRFKVNRIIKKNIDFVKVGRFQVNMI